jgi:FKBP-type peptidyl-prolyl cis-trans isomerase
MHLTDTRRLLGLMAIALTLTAVTAGCGKNDQSSTDTAGTAASPATDAATTMGPPAPAAPANTGADNTAVPDSTTIDGKKVALKKTASGLRYYDTKEGTGAVAKTGQTASVQYTGTLLDGTKFDSSYDHTPAAPFDFPLGGGLVIKGWDEGVAGMKVGGKRRLVVPGDLAYGPGGRDAIPPNATLVFDVELVGIK